MTIKYFHEVDERIRKCNQCLEVITLADHQAALAEARGQAIQDFIHGRTKLCLVCGAKEPCELKHDPHSPCTFEPTPMELMEEVTRLLQEKDIYRKDTQHLSAKLSEKDARMTELEVMRDESTRHITSMNITIGRYEKQLAEKDALLAQAIKFAKVAARAGISPSTRELAEAFLSQHRKGASHE